MKCKKGGGKRGRGRKGGERKENGVPLVEKSWLRP